MRDSTSGRWFAMAASGAALALGCSGTTTTREAQPLTCHATSDCARLGPGYQCISDECRGTAIGGDGSSLEGTWDVVGTQYAGPPTSLVVSVSSTELSIVTRGGSFLAVAQGDHFSVDWSYSLEWYGKLAYSFDATRTPKAGAAGIVPLPLFGDWQLQGPKGATCAVTVGSSSTSGSCGSALGTPPAWAPRIDRGTMTAIRTEALGSVFGDLGGAWTVTFSGPGTCSVRLEGSTITSQCAGDNIDNGTMSFSYDQSTAHGVTSHGIEFSAQRR